MTDARRKLMMDEASRNSQTYITPLTDVHTRVMDFVAGFKCADQNPETLSQKHTNNCDTPSESQSGADGALDSSRAHWQAKAIALDKELADQNDKFQKKIGDLQFDYEISRTRVRELEALLGKVKETLFVLNSQSIGRSRTKRISELLSDIEKAGVK